MTITFDCTEWMKEQCPAAVHVDGTARPQLVKREQNPGYYAILEEYEKLSGIPCLINTSFNMHEEPIVCTPEDAVRAFLDSRLDYLAIGPFLAEIGTAAGQPEETGERSEAAEFVVHPVRVVAEHARARPVAAGRRGVHHRLLVRREAHAHELVPQRRQRHGHGVPRRPPVPADGASSSPPPRTASKRAPPRGSPRRRRRAHP